MKRGLLIALGIVLVAVLSGLVWNASRRGEPVYEGKTLSQWLDRHVSNSSAEPPYGSPGFLKANEALRHIGTNGIPTLLEMIRAKDPPTGILKLRETARRWHLISTPYRYARNRNEEAAYAFELLGTTAVSAVPGLIKIYEESVTLSSQRCAALSLAHIGPAAGAAIPVLIRNFTHTNAEVRFYAVSAIPYLGGDPGVVIPALKSMLKDSKVDTRLNAVFGLTRWRRRARSAVPELVEALNDQAIKPHVENALWYIAPDMIPGTLVVETNTPMVANGVTTEDLMLNFNGQWRTLIPRGKAVPCSGACWDNEPRGPLSYYRGTNRTRAQNHFLGTFEVVGLAEPPTNVNAQITCIITDQQIRLCTRDYNREKFLEVRRIDEPPPPGP